jgi:hypothetical protein
VISYDAGFVDESATARLGSDVRWLFRGPNAHSVRSQLGILDTGPRPVGSVVSVPMPYAGSFAYTDALHPTLGGSVAVPVDAPTTATVNTPFTVTWATAVPLAHTRFDVEVLRPGSTNWVSWDHGVTGQNDDYTAGAAGAYAFRARLRNTMTGEHGGWSPPVTVQVQAR